MCADFIGLLLLCTATAFFILSLFCQTAFANSVSAASITQPITDETDTLSEEVKGPLSIELASLKFQKHIQVAVLIVPHLGSEGTIESYAKKVYKDWKFGKRRVSNAVLLVISRDDKQVRIEPEAGQKGAIGDAETYSIIEDSVTEHLKRSDLSGAVQEGVDLTTTAVNMQWPDGLPEEAVLTAGEKINFFFAGILITLLLALLLPPVVIVVSAGLIIWALTKSFILGFSVAVISLLLRLTVPYAGLSVGSVGGSGSEEGYSGGGGRSGGGGASGSF